MIILGISAFYHNSAAAILKNGKIVAAAEEERFSRKKFDSSFPTKAIMYCLSELRIDITQVDYIVFYEKPILKFDRLLETYLAFAPRGFKSFSSSLPLWVKDKLFQDKKILKGLELIGTNGKEISNKIFYSNHHLSHAASAFFPSPHLNAAILTMDGVGEWATTSMAVGSDNSIKTIQEIQFPHSLGLLYSAFTYFTGFKVNSGEYKIMGLAPYGEPTFVDEIKSKLIDIKDDSSFSINQKFFDYCTGLKMTNKFFSEIFESSPRDPNDSLNQIHMNLAASIQKVTEEVVLKLARELKSLTGLNNLCLAGGVALNCVANGKLLESNIFEKIWIQPASGDSGGALGAALAFYYLGLGKNRFPSYESDSMNGGYLGPQFNVTQIEKSLIECKAVFDTLDEEDLIKTVSESLNNGKVIGWMDGRMEFGPRALGSRSILADPRSNLMQKKVNMKVKFRESFRPFAPSILREDLEEWFELSIDSPYMLFVSKLKQSKRFYTPNEKKLKGLELLYLPRSQIPAVTHVDYTARIQTVSMQTNFRFHKLLNEFKKLTGCPILLNTSFNVRGEPIVCTPVDAFKCFMRTDIDVLVIGNSIMFKDQQLKDLISNQELEYETD